jgi:hypothetical protein
LTQNKGLSVGKQANNLLNHVFIRFIVVLVAQYTNGDTVVINVALLAIEEEVVKACF